MTEDRIDVVLFDLDDTLLAHAEAVQSAIRSYVTTLDGVYRGVDEHQVGRLWLELEEHHYHRYLSGELDFQGQRRARARDFAAAYGDVLDDEAATVWFDRYFERYIDEWRLYPDAERVLHTLRVSRPAVRLGIITNGDSAFQLRKIAALGLDDAFEHIVASGDLGVVKPDAAIFEHACSLFDAAPERCLYVGDRLLTDAVGAARSGVRGVWIDRTGTTPSTADSDVVARESVVRITALDELDHLL